MRTMISFLMAISFTASASMELIEAVRKGDLATVQETFAAQEHYQKKVLCVWAMREKQIPVLEYILANGYPRWDIDISYLFTDKGATPDIAQVFVEKCPSFMAKFGFSALESSVIVGNTETVLRLLELGVDPSDPKGTGALLKATGMSNTAMAKLLMEHGADPYMKDASQRMNAVQFAVKHKLIRMVRLLDTKNEFIAFLNEFERKWAAPSNSRFVGFWVYLKEGFGSVSLVLRDDGTGIINTDVIMMNVLWKGDGKALRLYCIGQEGEVVAEPTVEFRMERNGNQFALVSADETVVLTRSERSDNLPMNGTGRRRSFTATFGILAVSILLAAIFVVFAWFSARGRASGEKPERSVETPHE